MLLRDATVVDGTGAVRYRADVVLRDGRIAGIEAAGSQPDAESTINADGLVVAPGFIDMHAHSDLELLRDGNHAAKLLQGVTTEVIGQDGLAYAPVNDAALADLRIRIAGWHGDLEDDDFTWRNVGEYLDRLDRGTPSNAAYLVPQGNLRLMAIGHAARPATGGELDRMRGTLRDGLADGAFGMSSGLTYAPGMHADADELVSLCRVVAEHGGFWSPHTRSYGGGALDAYREAIGIARRSGCPVHLTHATMNFAVNRGRANELLELVDDAVDEGIDVTLDAYPYLAGATTLAALLPSWVLAEGLARAASLLEDPEALVEIERALQLTGSDGAHGEIVDWNGITISGVLDPALEPLVGRSVAELVGDPLLDRPDSPFEAAMDLLRRDRFGTGVLMHVGDEPNVRRILSHPRHLGGSDGILVGSRPHPRGWGAFPRYLAKYSREHPLLPLEEWVRHLAGSPARRLGLHDRGTVHTGAIADLVLFDPVTIADASTYTQPRQSAVGVRWVLIGGEVVVADGAITGERRGRALRHAGGMR